MCVPLAPFFFRRKHKALAHEGQHWRTCAAIFAVLFSIIAGRTASAEGLWAVVPERFRPVSLTEELAFEGGNLAAVAAPPAVQATPAPPSYGERVASNQKEFARLAAVYDSLKLERGYLRKHDDEGIKAYNALVATYQTDLAKARAEQTELIHLIAKK
jgi:hypothetical protein